MIAIAVNRLILMPYYDVRYSWIIDLPDKCRAIESKIAGLWLAFLILFAMPTILALDRLIDYSLKQQEAIKNIFSSMNVNKSQNGEVIQFRILAKNVLQNYSIWLIFLGTFIDLTNIILKEHNIIDIFKRNF